MLLQHTMPTAVVRVGGCVRVFETVGTKFFFFVLCFELPVSCFFELHLAVCNTLREKLCFAGEYCFFV